MSQRHGSAPEIDLNSVDLLDPGIHARDPHRIWDALRLHSPVHRQDYAPGRHFWSVTRYKDACRVLGEHDTFTSERGTVITQLGHDDVASGLLLTSCDPPRHTEVRRPLNARFTTRAVRVVEHRIGEAVERLLDGIPPDGSFDLAQRAWRLPMMVAGHLLGLPESGWDELTHLTGMAAAPEDPAFSIGSRSATLAVAHHQLFAYFNDVVATRRRTSETDDVIQHLLTLQAGNVRLSEPEILYDTYSLLLGANATTPHTVSGTVVHLAGDNQTWNALLHAPNLIDGLVEEGLRWTSAASNFMRYAVRPVHMAGRRIEAGDPVVVWIGSANRDSEVFDRPHEFDVARSPNRHLAFGYGPHYCLGASLARMTFHHVFAGLVARFSSVELDGEPTVLRSAFINGVSHLPVRVSPRVRS